MVNKTSGRKAAVMLAPGLSLRRRKRTRAETSDAQALAAPVPGELLVLLSRLHRREDTVLEATAQVVPGDALPSDFPDLSPRNRDL